MKLIIASVIVVVLRDIPVLLSLSRISNFDRTEGQTKNRSVNIARVSCLFLPLSLSLCRTSNSYTCARVCANQAYIGEGQKMMTMVVVFDLLDGDVVVDRCYVKEKKKGEEREKQDDEKKKIQDRWIFE